MDSMVELYTNSVKYLCSINPVSLFIGSFSFWLASHFAVLTVFELLAPHILKNGKQYVNKIRMLPPHRLSNFRRLLRSLWFCIVACSFGFYLLFNYYHHYPDDLLLAWSDNHNVAFFVAIGHWSFCFLEDYWAGEAVHSFTKLEPEASRMFRKDLIRHHVITVFAYAWCLSTHYLSALCVFGLCFELPVFFISYREILFGYDDVFNTLDTLSFLHFKRLWMCVYTTWHLTRTIFCMHWPWSLIFWRAYLSTIPFYSIVVYHFLGIAFNYANFKILTTVLSNYALEDAKRFGIRVKKTGGADVEVGGYSVEIPKETSLSHGSAVDDDDIEKQHNVSSAQGACPRYMKDQASSSGGCPFSSSGGRKLIGPKELSEHNTAESCWILIRGKVYDVTDFLSEHPGGKQILIRNSGKDASEEFTRANHSSNAAHMMSKYVVAEMLPHGYDQVGVTPEIVPMTAEEKKEMRRKQAEAGTQYADTSEPFHLLQRYFTFYDPVIPSILLPLLAILWMRRLSPEIVGVLSLRSDVAASANGAVAVAGGGSSAVPAETHLLWLSTMIAVRFTVLAGLLLFTFSNSIAQQTFIPGFVRFWIPASWTGAPSSWMNAIWIHSQLLWSIRIHAGAMGWIASWISLAYLLMHPLGLGTARVAFIMGTFIEYMSEYVSFAIHDAFPGRGLWGVIQYFRPLFLCKSLMDSLDSLKYVGVWLLCITLALEAYGVAYGGHFDVVATSGANSTGEPMLLSYFMPSVMNNYIAANWTPVWSVYLAWFVFGLGRALYGKSINIIQDRLSSDSYGATAIVLIIAAIYSIVIFFALAGGATDLTGLDGTSLDAARTGKFLFPAWAVARDAPEAAWAFGLYFSEALAVTILATSYSVFISMTRGPFASHVQLSGCALLLWFWSPSIGGGWWSFFWFIMAIHCFGKDTSKRFQSIGMFGSGAPAYWFRIKEVEEKFRYYTLFAIYTLIIIPIINIMTAFAPYNNRFWAPPGLIVDIPNGEYGVAMMLNAKDQKEPTVFQCNIGYMTLEGPDLVGTVQQTQQMLQEIATDPDAGKKGFVSDMVVVFQLPASSPARQQGYDFREVNFSAWENETAAYNWYKNSTAHKRIVKDYYNAGLHSFGALLARLKAPPEAPLRWEVRCQTCRKMVLGPKVDLCPYCNSQVQSLPYL